MNDNELLKKLERIEAAIDAKGHPMQDYSTLKSALLDVIEVMKKMIKEETNAPL